MKFVKFQGIFPIGITYFLGKKYWGLATYFLGKKKYSGSDGYTGVNELELKFHNFFHTTKGDLFIKINVWDVHGGNRDLVADFEKTKTISPQTTDENVVTEKITVDKLLTGRRGGDYSKHISLNIR